MTQFYVFEIKLSTEGEYEHEVHWVYNADPDVARLMAESKYHEVLTRAAVSSFRTHSATLLTGDGIPLMDQCYTHKEKGGN